MNRSIVLEYFKDPPEMRTSRLTLRRMLKRDAKDMYEYASDPTVTKYLLWDPHPSPKYTARYLSYLQGRYRAGEFYDWAVTLNDSGKMIGTCGFTDFDFSNNSAEVGYVLNPDQWHRGIALEALLEVMRFGFLHLGLHRIEARYIVGNESSRRVMEKAGMTFEGVSRHSLHLKGSYVSVGTCSILREEFLL